MSDTYRAAGMVRWVVNLTDILDLPWDHLWYTDGPDFQALGYTPGADINSWPDEFSTEVASAVGATDPLYSITSTWLNSQTTAAYTDAEDNGLKTAASVFGTVSQPFSIVAIFAVQDSYIATASENITIFDSVGVTNRVFLRYVTGEHRLCFGSGTQRNMDAVVSEGEAILAVCYFDGVNSELELNGSIVELGLTTGTNGWTGFTIGNAQADSVNARFPGEISLLGFYQGDIRTVPGWTDVLSQVESKYNVNFQRYATEMFETDYSAIGLCVDIKIDGASALAYVANQTADVIDVYDLTQLPNLVSIGTSASIINPGRMVIQGTSLFVPAGGSNLLRRYDISGGTPASPTDSLTTNVSNPRTTDHRSSSVIHMGNASNRINTFDPTTLVNIGGLALSITQNTFSIVTLDSNWILVGRTSSVFSAQDTNGTTAPVTTGGSSVAIGGDRLVVNGTVCYTSTGGGVLGIIDASDPSNLSIIQTLTRRYFGSGGSGHGALSLFGTDLYSADETAIIWLDATIADDPVLIKGLYYDNSVKGNSLAIAPYNDYLLIGTSNGLMAYNRNP